MWYKIKRTFYKFFTWLLWLLSFFKNPVERDRWLFGRNGFGMLKFSLNVVIFVLGVLCLIAFFIPDVNKILLGNASAKIAVSTGQENDIWAILSQFADPGNLPSAQKEGHLFALTCALAGVFCLSGLAVSSLISFINRVTERWKQGLLRYDYKFDKYIVIIGCNEQTANIVKLSLKRPDVKYVLIQTRQNVEKMRMKLSLNLDSSEEERIVFYYGERTSREDIESLCLEKALEIYILGEGIHVVNEEDHDVSNICCLEHISEYFKNKCVNDKKRVHVSLEYQSTFTAFKSTQIYKSLDKNVEFLPFNIYDIWAKKILVDNFAVIPVGKKGELRVQNYLPIDSEAGIAPGDNKTVHLVIMGMNQMGTAIASQAAFLAHFPNTQRDAGLRTTITFIDDQAKKEGEFFRGRFASMFDLCRYRTIEVGAESFDKEWYDPMKEGRYRHLGDNFMDIQWEFVQGNVASDEVRQYVSDISKDENKITTIAICFNHQQQSVATALYLPEFVYRRASQILVYQQNSFDLAEKIATGEKVWKRYEKLRPFGMIEGSYTEDTFDNSKAKILQYLYAHKKIGRHVAADSSLGGYTYRDVPDLSSEEDINVEFVRKINKLWNQQGIVIKLSNIDMVDSIPMKLRSLGLTVDNLDNFADKLKAGNTMELMAKSEHLRWVTERVLMGFRPLDDVDSEWRMFVNHELDPARLRKEKNFRKEKSRAHLDICSNEMLGIVDPGVHYNDIDVISYIPQVLNYKEWVNIMKLAEIKSRSSIAGKLLQDFVLTDVDGVRSFAPRFVQQDNMKFWIMETAVTQKQWKSIMGNNPAPQEYTQDGKPAICISKNDIDDFLKALRKMTGLHFDLPTFDEWRCAALNSTKDLHLYETDNVLRLSKGKDDKEGPSDVRANERLQKNSLGIYNMLGNVWEWTKTLHLKDDKNDDGCFYFCGGSWRLGKLHCDLNNDYWNSFWKPALKSDDIGFRLVWRFNLKDVSDDKTSTIRQILSDVALNPYVSRVSEEQQKDYIREKLIHMVPVESGYFVMGTENKDTRDKCPEYPESWIDDKADTEETPHYFVKMKKFHIADTPVTQELWNIVMGIEAKANPSDNTGDNNPQTNVSWNEINDVFLPRLNKITGENYRLPTAAEWEYAAKGGHKTEISKTLTMIFECKDKSVEEKLAEAYRYMSTVKRYPLYSGTDDYTKLDLYVQATTSGVKDRMPNTLGIYDMSGNIWEWCHDYYQTDFNSACKQQADYKKNGYITNPECSDPMYTLHVFKGGSWHFDADNCRNTGLNFWVDTDTDDDLGFRLVKS